MKINFAILTISDRAATGQRVDQSGPALSQQIQSDGYEIVKYAVVPDDFDQIIETLIAWCDLDSVHILLTTGGTGFGQRDVTPEATTAVIQRPAPGFSELIRSKSMIKIPHAILSRGVSGIRNKTLIVNLPGSPIGAVESYNFIKPVLDHAVEILLNFPSAEEGHRPKK